MARATILIVEDKLPSDESLWSQVTSLGYSVSALVASREEAVRLAGELHPDLVLMDVQPGGEADVVEAADKIRAHHGMPVIYLLPPGEGQPWQRIELTEPFGYLLKPVRLDSLRTAIETALYKRDVERKLRENEARYRLISELTSDFAYSFQVDPDGTWRLRWLTGAFTGITGYRWGELEPRDAWMELVHPEDRQLARQQLQVVLSGQPGEAEFRIVTREGETRWLHIYNYPVLDVDGDLAAGSEPTIRIYGAARDVTERRSVSDALQRNSERLQILREIDQSILAARAPETIALAAIRRIRRLIPCQRIVVLAVERDGQLRLLATESHGNIKPVAGVGMYRSMLREGILSGGGIQGVEDLASLVRQSSPQQTLVAEGVRSYVIIPLFVQGELVGTLHLESDQPRVLTPDHINIGAEVAASLAVAIRQAHLYAQAQREIVDRMRAEEQIRHQNEFLNTILDSLSHPFYVLDPNDYTIQLANSHARLYGLVEGATCYALTHGLDEPCTAPDCVCPIRQVQLTGKPVTVEHTHLGPDGKRYPVEVHGHPILNAEGKVVRIVEYSIDITDRREAERVRQEAAAAAERERLARDLHDAVTQTLFSASLIAEALPELWKVDAAEAERSLEKLRSLTRGALTEMRTLLLELRPTALLERPLDELLRHLAEALTNRSRVPVEMFLDQAWRPPAELQIALYRIAQEALNNIAQHAGASRATLNFRCHEGRVELRIGDNGCGFDPGAIPPGHLGLDIMRERAARVSAAFEIESEPGQGTQVRVHWQQDKGGRGMQADEASPGPLL